MMLSIRHNQSGLSLVEMVVAISIFMVVALASAMVFTTVIKISAKDKVVQEIQREGDAVVSAMARNLREAVSVDTVNSNFTTNPHSIQVKLANNQTRKYYVTGNQLHYVNEAGVDENLLQSGTTVTSLTITPGSDTTGLQVFTTRITLSRTKSGTTQTLDFGSTINTRPQ